MSDQPKNLSLDGAIDEQEVLSLKVAGTWNNDTTDAFKHLCQFRRYSRHDYDGQGL